MNKHSRDLPATWLVNVAEILIVGLTAFVVIAVGWKIAGDNALGKQAVVWVANVMMLAVIWIGLRMRHQTWGYLGLKLQPVDRRVFVLGILKSIAVFLFALAGFIVGSIVATMI